jgi:hypothetical protein
MITIAWKSSITSTLMVLAASSPEARGASTRRLSTPGQRRSEPGGDPRNTIAVDISERQHPGTEVDRLRNVVFTASTFPKNTRRRPG